MFGRATITLGIGPHFWFKNNLYYLRNAARQRHSYDGRVIGNYMACLVTSVAVTLKMICNDLLVVKVNCWSYVFNIIKYM